MANEFIARKGLIISGSTRASGSITATSFTGSILGTSSVAISSSYVPNLYITSSDSAPSAPDINELWFDSTTGKTYIYYRSASVLQWVLQSDPTYDPGPSLQDLQDVTDLGSTTTNAITITNTTATINTSSGALIVSGGIGVKGAIHSNTLTTNTVTATTLVGTLTGTSSWASNAVTSSYVLPSGLPNGVISSSTQLDSLTAPITGSFTGSLRGSLTGTSSWASSASVAISSSYVLPSGLPNGVVSSSTQFNSLTAPFTGSFTGSHFGSLVGTSSWANSASVAISSSYVLPSGLPAGTVSSSTQFNTLTTPFTGSFTGSFTGALTGTSSFANTASVAITASVVTTNTVNYTAGAGLSGGGSATLGGAAVTIDAVAGAGISLTAPTNDAININTGSTHFTDGVKSKLNTEGVISSSTQFSSLTAPFTGSFTGSFRGALTGTGSWSNSASVALSSSYALTASYALNGGTGGSSGNTFATYSISGQSDVIADSPNDTLTLVAGSGITLTTNASTDSITIAATAADPQAFNIDTYEFIGDGTTVNYNVVNSYALNSLFVMVDGITFNPTDDYTISTNTLTFVTSPPSQSSILVRAFVNATTGVTGSFSGSFFGTITSASYAATSSVAISASWAPGGSGTVTSVAAGDGLAGGTITSAGTISLNTSSAHFLDGVKKELNTEGVISSSTQFTSLTAPFTGSFTGSFTGALTGTSSWAQNAVTASFASNGVTNGVLGRIAYYSSSNVLTSSATLTFSPSNTLTFTSGTFDIINEGSTKQLGLASNGLNGPFMSFLYQGGSEMDFGRSEAISSFGKNYDLMTYVDRGIAFYTNNQYTPKMLISASGNVGIGEGAPIAKLQVQGNISASSYTSSVSNGVGFQGTSSFAVSASYAPGGGGSVTINNNTANYLVTATGTANTLDGEANLQFDGTVLSGSAASIFRAGTGSVTTPAISVANDTNTGIYFPGGDGISLGAGGIAILNISQSSVGIGTTAISNRKVLISGSAGTYPLALLAPDLFSLMSFQRQTGVDSGYIGLSSAVFGGSTTDMAIAGIGGGVRLGGNLNPFVHVSSSGANTGRGTMFVSGSVATSGSGVGFVGTSSFAVSASWAPGSSGVTINTNTNNYLVTATGTANTLDGEANLTFNGSLLTVTGGVSASGGYTGSISNFNPSTLKITVGTTAPSSPAVNDLWVDTN